MKNNNGKRVGAELMWMKKDAGESPLHMALNAGLEEVALKLVEGWEGGAGDARQQGRLQALPGGSLQRFRG
jgi:hypothetical protein